MASIRRRLTRMGKRVVKQDGEPRWLILHYSYTDGGEVFEVRSLDTGRTKRFTSQSEMDAWLRKARRTRMA